MCSLLFLNKPRCLHHFIASVQKAANVVSQRPHFQRALDALPHISRAVSSEQILSMALVLTLGGREDWLAAAELLTRANLWPYSIALLKHVSQRRNDYAHLQLFNLMINLCLELKAYSELTKVIKYVIYNLNSQILDIPPPLFNPLDLLHILETHTASTSDPKGLSRIRAEVSLGDLPLALFQDFFVKIASMY